MEKTPGQEIQNKIIKTCDELKKLLIEKNKMYGNSFYETLREYGNSLVCVRIEDKLNRLKQIILKGQKDEQTDERVIDTAMDLAGYAILSKIFFEYYSHLNSSL